MSSFARRLTASVVVAGVAFTGVASAKPTPRSYGKTFPVASVLCKRTDAGKVPKKLKDSAPQVLAACATLQTSFDAAATTVVGAQATFKANRAAALADAKTACTAPGATRADCRAAGNTARDTIKAALAVRTTAFQGYRDAIEAARKAFWTSIRALRGGTSITPDAPVPPTAPIPVS